MGLLSLLAPERKPAPLLEPAMPSGRLLVGLIGLVFAAFLASLDQRLTTVASADMIGNFDFGQDEGSWITTAYTVGDIAIVPMMPWLGQVLSLRRMAAFQIVLFCVASAAVPLHRDYAWMVACRCLQGLGEGGLIPLMLMAVLQKVPPHRRPDALVLYGLLITCVPLMADSVAGVMTDLFTWRGLFYVSPALGPVALFMVLAGLPVEPAKWPQFWGADYFGIFCLVVICVAVSVGLTQGQRLDWFDSGFIDATVVLAVFFVAAFVLNEWLRARPLYELSLFENRNFAIGLAMIVVFTTLVLGVSTLMPQDQMRIRFLRELQIGNITLWLLLPQVVVGPLVAWVLRHLDARLVLAAGLGLVCIGAWLCVWITPVWAGDDFMPLLVVQACGWPMVLVPLAFITTSALRKKDALTGGAMFNIFRSLGTTAGSAVLGAIVTVRERVHSDNDIVAYLDPGRQAVINRLQDPGVSSRLYGIGRANATVMAFADAYGWVGILAVAALLLVLLQKETAVTEPPKV